MCCSFASHGPGGVEYDILYSRSLATSTMAQPVGSILGTNPTSRTYLRSWPIFCAFSALQFIVEIVLLRIYYFDSLQGAAIDAAGRIFKHVANESENLTTFRIQAVVRWAFFLLGTHGCIFKLASAIGIPWSKTWGFA